MAISANDTLSGLGGSGESLLRGSDLKKSERQVIVKCTAIREPAPGFLSPLIMEIECDIDGKTGFPLNKTNIRKLAELVGDDLEQAVGKKIVLDKELVNNPKTNTPTYGLKIVAVRAR